MKGNPKLKSRRERRQESGKDFQPIYAEGKEPKSYEEHFGIGYERFDGKYVKVSDKVSKGRD